VGDAETYPERDHERAVSRAVRLAAFKVALIDVILVGVIHVVKVVIPQAFQQSSL
jgi:hypothetical protein